MRYLAVAATGFALALLGQGAANAGSIYTPIIFLGGADQLVCIASNTEGAPLDITVRIIGSQTTSTTSCTVPAGDRGGCQGFKNNESGRCKISVANLTNAQVRARVRGVMFARKITAPFTIGALVQAE
jgi:hypothetical protein